VENKIDTALKPMEISLLPKFIKEIGRGFVMVVSGM